MVLCKMDKYYNRLKFQVLWPTNDRLTGFAKTCRAAIPEAIKFNEKPICVKIDL